MEIGVWDATKSKGVSIEEILKAGKKVFNKVAGKPKIKDEQVLERVKSEQKQKTDERSEEVRKNIEKTPPALWTGESKAAIIASAGRGPMCFGRQTPLCAAGEGITRL